MDINASFQDFKSQFAIAITIARIAHLGQYRRDGITPYIKHVEQVINNLFERFNKEGDFVLTENTHLQNICFAVAALHDVIEDTDYAEEYLKEMGIHEDVIHAVKLLTKTEGQDYNKYLEGVSTNYFAMLVKIADMEANLADKPTKRQVERYTAGIKFLNNKLNQVL